MGWPWSSSAESPSDEKKSLSSTPQAPAESTNLSSAATSTPSKALSRDEIADQELQSFLRDLEADTHTSSKKYNRVPRPVPSSSGTDQTKKNPRALPSSSSSSPPLVSNSGGDGPLSEQLLPTTMSCRTAFDAAFYCNSFGGRFNDLYRYGTLRSCSDTWNDFWFCMKTRGYSSPQKEEVIREHYRKKEWAKYGGERGQGRSSEDVWRSREGKIGVGEAFVAEDEAFKRSDEEWNRMERMRRSGAGDGSMG